MAKAPLMLLLSGILLAASRQEESCEAPAASRGEEASWDGVALLQHVRKAAQSAGLDEEALLRQIREAADASDRPGSLRDLLADEDKHDGVAGGLKQMLDSILLKPTLPSAAQVEAACPAGKDCTRSVVMDPARRFLQKFDFMEEHGVNKTKGVCYNAPYYYARECVVAKSPNAAAAMDAPYVVRGTTCEEQGYARWPAFYADPFYGWHNNVSLFVKKGLLHWAPIAADLLMCEECVESLTLGGWGRDWKLKNPECK